MDPCPISIILLYFPIPIVYTKKNYESHIKARYRWLQKKWNKSNNNFNSSLSKYLLLFIYIYKKKKERKKVHQKRSKEKKNRSILRCKTIQWWNKKKTRSRNAINYAVAFNLNNTVLCQHFFRIFFFFLHPFFLSYNISWWWWLSCLCKYFLIDII